MIRHYYHVWADGDWEGALYEHVTALEVAALDCDMTVGVVGAEHNRISALVALGELVDAIEADTGWEQVTLSRLWQDARQHTDDTFLYCHTKGAYHPSPLNTAWRRSMTGRLVLGWESCVQLLASHDAVGCHWVCGSAVPDPYWIFAGNFWWATGRYLATLPDPADWTSDRFEAERWLGRGQPSVACMREGWPSEVLFEPDDDPALASQFGPFWSRWRFGLPEPSYPVTEWVPPDLPPETVILG